jgi:hypothetical protein
VGAINSAKESSQGSNCSMIYATLKFVGNAPSAFVGHCNVAPS